MQRLAFLACLMLISHELTAEPGEVKAKQIPEFQKLEYKDEAGNVLPYRLLIAPVDNPKASGEDETKRPVLIFLHGAGERGDDNVKQLLWGKAFMEKVATEQHAIVIVPQCPEGQRWVEVDWSKAKHKTPDKPGEPMRLTMELLEKIEKNHDVDPDRIYIMGLSMGGFGTWDALARYPDRFAAGVPICGGGDIEKAAVLRNKPIWAFHGGADRVVPVARSRDMIEAIKKAGGEPKYTEYEGVGHNSWSPAFKDQAMFEWLFTQQRKARK